HARRSADALHPRAALPRRRRDPARDRPARRARRRRDRISRERTARPRGQTHGEPSMIEATFVVLVIAAALFFWRMLRGPTLADRVNALNGLVVVGISAVAAHAIDTKRGSFIPVIVVITLVNFVGTAM